MRILRIVPIKFWVVAGIICFVFLANFVNNRIVEPIRLYEDTVYKLDSTNRAVKDTLRAIEKGKRDSLRISKKRIATIEDLEKDVKIKNRQISELQRNLWVCGRDYRKEIKRLKEEAKEN